MSDLFKEVSGSGLDLGWVGVVRAGEWRELAEKLAARGHRIHLLDFGEADSGEADSEGSPWATQRWLSTDRDEAQVNQDVLAWQAETPCDLVQVFDLGAFSALGPAVMEAIADVGQPLIKWLVPSDAVDEVNRHAVHRADFLLSSSDELLSSWGSQGVAQGQVARWPLRSAASGGGEQSLEDLYAQVIEAVTGEAPAGLSQETHRGAQAGAGDTSSQKQQSSSKTPSKGSKEGAASPRKGFLKRFFGS